MTLPLVLAFQAPVRRATAADLPLLRAIARKDERAASQAIDAGASPSAYVVDHETMLMRAATTGSVGMVRLLVRRGADVRARAMWGYGVLDAAAGGPAQSQPAMVEALLALGARPGKTTLWSYVDRAPIVRLLLKAKAPIAPTSLNRAIETDRLDSLRLMLAAKPPLDQTGRSGSPLHVAAKAGKIEAARLLLAHGAKRGLRDDEGRTAAQVAAATGHDAVAALLGLKVAPLPPLTAPVLTNVAKSFAQGLRHAHDYAWRADGGLVVWRPVVEPEGALNLGAGVVVRYDPDGKRTSARTDPHPFSDASLSPDGERMVWSDEGTVSDCRIDGTDVFVRTAAPYVHVAWTADGRQWTALGWNTGPGSYDRIYWRDGRAEPLAPDCQVRPLGDEIDPTWIGDRDHVRTVTFARGLTGVQDRRRGTIVATSLTPTAAPKVLGTLTAPRGGTIEEAAFSPDGRRVAWLVTLPRDHRVGVWTSLADGTGARCVGTMPDRSPSSYGVQRDVWIGWRLAAQPHHLRWTTRGGLSFVVEDALRVVPGPV